MGQSLHVPHGDWRRFLSEQGLTDTGDDWSKNIKLFETR
jgi:hypothetical protein